jgi:transposase
LVDNPAHTEQIEIFYLPSYSPELNPDELLNADLEQRVTTAAPARTKRGLTQSAVRALRSVQNSHKRVRNYFRQEDVSCAA